MEAADCTNNKDSEVEEVEANFYETVSEPSLKYKKRYAFMCSSHAQRYSARKQKDGKRTGRAKVILRHSRNTTKSP